MQKEETALGLMAAMAVDLARAQAVKVELVDASLLESFGELQALQKKIHDRLKSVLGLETKVTLVSPKSLERFQGKAKRVLDLRNQPEAE